MSDQFQIVAYRERPELLADIAQIELESVPDFINQDPVWAEVFPHF